jgi:hypothetical protein
MFSKWTVVKATQHCVQKPPITHFKMLTVVSFTLSKLIKKKKRSENIKSYKWVRKLVYRYSLKTPTGTCPSRSQAARNTWKGTHHQQSLGNKNPASWDASATNRRTEIKGRQHQMLVRMWAMGRPPMLVEWMGKIILRASSNTEGKHTCTLHLYLHTCS